MMTTRLDKIFNIIGVQDKSTSFKNKYLIWMLLGAAVVQIDCSL